MGCVEKSPQELPPTEQLKAMKPSMKMSEKPTNTKVTPAVRTGQNTDGSRVRTSRWLSLPHRQGAPPDTRSARPRMDTEALRWILAVGPTAR